MLRSLISGAASQLDVAFGAALFHRSAAARARSKTESLSHGDRLAALRVMTEVWDKPEHYASGSAFFARPEGVTPRLEAVRSLPGGRVADAYWPSAFTLHDDGVAERYLGVVENRTAAARLFLHEGAPRPAVILIHGYRTGQWGLEERVWPIEWLFGKGLDVALMVLPFHAVRAKKTGAPFFPGSDPRITNEGFRQAVFDTRALARWFLDRGSPGVGAMGMSLGGYTTALLATVEERLAFAVPMIPLASLPDMVRGMGRLVGSEAEQEAQHAALEAAHRVVSPLARPSKIASDRVLIVAAEGDRITPVSHAEKLSRHFGAPLEVLPGGHILQLWKREGFSATARMLGRLGLI